MKVQHFPLDLGGIALALNFLYQVKRKELKALFF